MQEKDVEASPRTTLPSRQHCRRRRTGEQRGLWRAPPLVGDHGMRSQRPHLQVVRARQAQIIWIVVHCHASATPALFSRSLHCSLWVLLCTLWRIGTYICQDTFGGNSTSATFKRSRRKCSMAQTTIEHPRACLLSFGAMELQRLPLTTQVRWHLARRPSLTMASRTGRLVTRTISAGLPAKTWRIAMESSMECRKSSAAQSTVGLLRPVMKRTWSVHGVGAGSVLRAPKRERITSRNYLEHRLPSYEEM
mmetsp:Transcript_31634/g.87324  ORF Transcript_31634/g.87324 Transcript_31634/m.87324 type:complete len:250 (+) Transcript_31634:345-1094(+)